MTTIAKTLSTVGNAIANGIVLIILAGMILFGLMIAEWIVMN